MPRGARVLAALPLTERQHHFMLALQHRLERDPDRGVSYEELRQDLGLSSKSGVARLVQECVVRGRISRSPRLSRSLRVLAPVEERYEGEPASFPLPSSLARFTDADIIMEAARRGLVSANS